MSGNRLKYLIIFNRGIDTMNITALFNHKPGILSNYIRIVVSIMLKLIESKQVQIWPFENVLNSNIFLMHVFTRFRDCFLYLIHT